ncbi:MAG: hypothetical protein ASARMPRED_008973 [Alectoria sarmentosa]|nr:MAG: hypothetical protein ASARMPRED_008973 [Alectoria sarmentosa]
MHATGNRPPGQIKNKDEWVNKERLRWAKSFGVPMAEGLPPGFPPNTLKVQRALTVVALRHPERLADTIAAIYHASFTEQKEVHTPENITPIFEKIFGEVGTKEILEESTSDKVKKLLTAKTGEALAEGSFGLPWFVGEYLNPGKEWQ